MNSPLLNNYIQYLNLKGQVKTKSVTFVKNDTNTTFEVSGIIEEFFILAVFENNIKKSGIGFENIDNIDMLAFVNSNFFDVNLIPQNHFLPSEQVVVMSYNNEYNNTKSNVIFPDVQTIKLENEDKPIKVSLSPLYDPYKYSIDLSKGNAKIEGIFVHYDHIGWPLSTAFIDTLNQGFRSYQPDINNGDAQVSNHGGHSVEFCGFSVLSFGDNVFFDFLVDTEHNTFSVVPSVYTNNPYLYSRYEGCRNGVHKWVLTDKPYNQDVRSYFPCDYFLTVNVAYKVPVGSNIPTW